MNDQLRMCTQMTSSLTPSATSLPASESGLSLCVGPDGQMTFLDGPGLVRVSLTPRQAKEKGDENIAAYAISHAEGGKV